MKLSIISKLKVKGNKLLISTIPYVVYFRKIWQVNISELSKEGGIVLNSDSTMIIRSSKHQTPNLPPGGLIGVIAE
jgi:hypothetical protein